MSRSLPLALSSPARAVALTLVALLATACSRDSTRPAEAGYRLSVRTGVEASGPATGTLRALPLFVVQDGDGAPVPGVRLRLQASSGLTLPDTDVLTGPDGIARVSVTLGATSGVQTITAVIAGNTRERAEVDVTIGPRPTITQLVPASFASGDTIEVIGSNWLAGETPVAVVGGIRARTVQTLASGVRVVVPPCVTSGGAGAVAVSVTLGDVVSTPAAQGTLTSTGTALALEPLQGVTVPATLVEQCLALGGPGAEYVVAPHFADPGEADASVTLTPVPISYALGTGVGSGPVTSRALLSRGRAAAPSAQVAFERRRRADEARLAGFAAAAGPQPLAEGSAPSLQLSVPQTRQFYVLETLDQPETFTRVTARLRYGGERVVVYVDEAAPSGGFTDADLQQLGRLFDTKLYTLATTTFGMPSDVDRNGRVIVLLTPVVNGLAPYPDCLVSGTVNGYFWGRDLITPALPNSNHGEVFYAMVPDPRGETGGCPASAASVRQSVPATFVHELQHMISYNQHVIARGGRQEADWLNEGLSHIAEDLASLMYEGDPSQPRSTPEQLFPDSSQGFIVPNVLNAIDYLGLPSASSLTIFRDLGTLPERGAAWLFLRWLGDQKGPEIYRRLSETRATGAANVEAQANEPFQQLFADWVLALYADLNPAVDRAKLDPRYRYLTRDFRAIFARFHDLNEIPDPFPISPGELPASGRVQSSMVPGAMDYYVLSGAPGQTVLRFTTPNDGPLPANRFPQVGILRIR